MNSAGQGIPGDPYGYKPNTFKYGFPTVYPTVAEQRTVALKPCPFCGSDATLKYPRKSELTYSPTITCNKCNAEIWAGSKEEAIEMWNRRVRE